MSGAFVVDAHHHFWDPAEAEYPWMTGEVAPIRRRFGPEDLRPLLAQTGVDRTILVQTRSSLEETTRFLRVAEDTPFIAGVVGWVDLTQADAGREIASLRKGPGGRFLVGIRHQVHDEPDPGWLRRPDVLRGLAAIRDAGLVYDLLLRPPHLPAALEVARSLTDLRFVIDHIAKPRIGAGPKDAEWAAGMAPFSDLANVSCKLSGMVTEAAWASWTTSDLEPYVDRCVAWFGDERLMFGSDWPVCLLAATYDTVVETLSGLLGRLPAKSRARIFGENAARAYRLE